jgi:hypothetical protein
MISFFATSILANLCITLAVALFMTAPSLHNPDVSGFARLAAVFVGTVGVLGVLASFFAIYQRIRCCIHRH